MTVERGCGADQASSCMWDIATEAARRWRSPMASSGETDRRKRWWKCLGQRHCLCLCSHSSRSRACVHAQTSGSRCVGEACSCAQRAVQRVCARLALMRWGRRREGTICRLWVPYYHLCKRGSWWNGHSAQGGKIRRCERADDRDSCSGRGAARRGSRPLLQGPFQLLYRTIRRLGWSSLIGVSLPELMDADSFAYLPNRFVTRFTPPLCLSREA